MTTCRHVTSYATVAEALQDARATRATFGVRLRLRLCWCGLLFLGPRRGR